MDGHNLSIGGQAFARGFGTHAESVLYINLKNSAQTVSASVGVDDEVSKSTARVEFFVMGDGRNSLAKRRDEGGRSGEKFHRQSCRCQTLLLKVGDAGDGISYDHADWRMQNLKPTAMCDWKP
ncbi:MAG: NPCBM/NEW2 domain-containing protein [Limisphaerales bacterium]